MNQEIRVGSCVDIVKTGKVRNVEVSDITIVPTETEADVITVTAITYSYPTNKAPWLRLREVCTADEFIKGIEEVERRQGHGEF